MADVLVYHNPSCSKSRGALDILRERNLDAQVVEYLKTPPTRADLERILDAISDEPSALVRTDDDKFKVLGVPKPTTRAEVIDLLVEHPEVMQRPVVFVGDKAVIARPSDRVLELL
jgi:arsenate reductase